MAEKKSAPAAAELSDKYKDYTGFIVDGVYLPVEKGKIFISEEAKAKLEGYLK